MSKLYLPAILSSFLFIYSCKTASKSFQKGNYRNTIEIGVKKLQKNPNDFETKDLIQKSYSYEVSQHEDQIRILSKSRTDDRYEKIYQEYNYLQQLYNLVHQYPRVAQIISTTDYSDYLNTYAEKAAEVHLQNGDRFMNEGTKDAYRSAYREYDNALRLQPENYDIKKKRENAYNAAVLRVVILPIQNLGGYQYGANFQLENFYRDVIRTLSYNVNNPFIQFYTDYDARIKNIEPDQIMELNFSRITIDQPYDEKIIRDVSKEIVMKEIVYKKDSVVKQYGTVRARITTTKRNLLSQGDLFITVRDIQGRILWTDRFTGEHRWETEFTTYTGDERALSDNDKALLNQRNYDRPPSQDQILEDLLRQIQNDLSFHLRNYYTRFQ